MTGLLSHDRIQQLTRRTIDAGLANPTARAALMAGINRSFVAGLQLAPAPIDQLLLDLDAMSDVRLTNGEVPLKQWLSNVLFRLQDVDARSYVESVLADVSAAADEAPEPADGGVERVVHSDDLLPYDFLTGAVRVAESVARVTIVRHEHGNPVDAPGTDVPFRSFGTAWLLAPELVMTNHHVVAARSPSEPPVSPDDLLAQVGSMQVEFGVDRGSAVGDEVRAVALVAHDADLDYAIVRIPARRGAPLVLATSSDVQVAAAHRVPVNIVQHPGGGPKEVAIRNNLIASFDDTDLRYFTDTLAGSSGSPVCTDDWRVVALHKAWIRQQGGIEFQGKPTAWVNRGTRIDVVVDHLRSSASDVWDEIGGR